MPRRPSRAAVLVPLAALLVGPLTVLGPGGVSPAAADDSPPPVALDDTATVLGGRGPDEVAFVDVLANDSSPSGEGLEICRIQAPERGLSVAEVSPDGDFTISTPSSGVSASGEGGPAGDATETLAVLPWANRSGTYRFTYWACDTEHLAPATVTVTVERAPEVRARATGKPGRVRFVNPTGRRATVVYRGLRRSGELGRVRLAPGQRRTVSVATAGIRWTAYSPRTGQRLGEGVVRGLRETHSYA